MDVTYILYYKHNIFCGELLFRTKTAPLPASLLISVADPDPASGLFGSAGDPDLVKIWIRIRNLSAQKVPVILGFSSYLNCVK